VAGPEVPTLLARLNAHDPGLTIEVRLETIRAPCSTPLIAANSMPPSSGARTTAAMAKPSGPNISAGSPCRSSSTARAKPMRLAALAPSCGVRDIATRALDAMDIPWTEVFLGGSSSMVTAAVSAGLAIGAFSCRLAPAGTVEIGERFGLPELPPSEIVLHSTLTDGKSRGALRTLATAFREHRGATS
jgi:DNA-binding transcriptional LysR family regulator